MRKLASNYNSRVLINFHHLSYVQGTSERVYIEAEIF